MNDQPPIGSVLVVDDEPGFRSLIQWELSNQGLEVVTAEDGVAARECLKHRKFDVVVTDLSMPLLDGLMLLREIKKTSPATEVILITGFATVDTAVYAMQLGALDFVLKPFKVDRVSNRITQVLSGVFKKCACPITPRSDGLYQDHSTARHPGIMESTQDV